MTKSFLVGLFLTGLFLMGCGANRDSSSASSSSSVSGATPQHSPGDHAATTKSVPAHFSNVADARPLPAVLDPRRFSQPSVVKAYSYAKEIPEIFSQQPCYCNCDTNNGHRSLLDCFATDHGAT
jgi:Protein of unknown function with PCYCGC motif